MKNLRVKLSLKCLEAKLLSIEEAAKIKGGNGESTDGSEIVIVDTIVS